MFSGSSNMWMEDRDFEERRADIASWVEQSVAGVRFSARASLEQKVWTPDFYIPSQRESSTDATTGTYPAHAEEDDLGFSASTSGNQNNPKKNKTKKKSRRSKRKERKSKSKTPSNDVLQVPFGTEGVPSTSKGCGAANDTSSEDEKDNSPPHVEDLFQGLDVDGNLNYMPEDNDEDARAIWDLQPLSVLKEILSISEYEVVYNKLQKTQNEPIIEAPYQRSTHVFGWRTHTEDCVKKCDGCDLFYLKCTAPRYSNSDGGNRGEDKKDEDGEDEDSNAQCRVCGWKNDCDQWDEICRITGEILCLSQE